MKWELIWQLAKTDFKIRYNGSILGYLWALLKPLLIFLILNFVFSNIFAKNIPNYSLNLLVGIILWSYFAEGTMIGMTSLLSKASLITKVPIDKFIVVLASTIQSTISFIINLGILAIFFAYYHITPTLAALGLALVFFILIYLLIIGFSLLTSPLFLKYRDLNQIWEVLLQLGFFASPIIYPLSLIPLQLQKYLWLNPMSYLIHYSKLALINGQLMEPSRFFLLLAIIIFVLAIGLGVFRRLKLKVVEWI